MPKKNGINIIEGNGSVIHKVGEVWNESLFDQKFLFHGAMIYPINGRNVRPMDIDLTLEVSGKLFIYGEGKYKNGKLTTGQDYYLRHVVESHQRANDFSIAMLFRHFIPPEIKYVDVKDLPVIAFYSSERLGEWRTPKNPITVHNMISQTIEYYKDRL